MLSLLNPYTGITEGLASFAHKEEFMTPPRWVLRVLVIWVLLNGLLVAAGLSRLLQQALRPLPIVSMLAIVPIVLFVLAARALIKKQRGSRPIATGILAWTTIGMSRMVMLQFLGAWSYQYTPLNQILAICCLAANLACLAFMWLWKGDDPFITQQLALDKEQGW
jgi:hypothetical protein